MYTFQSIKKSKLILATAALLAGLTIAALLWGGPVWELFSSQEKLESVIADAGALGPLLLIVLQFLQTLIAPLPGGVVSFAAGYLFGTVLGTVYTMIGLVLGFTLIFVLARKFGRPFVERFVSKKNLDKFDYLVEDKGVFIIFLIFLMPFFPDDLLCYIVGLTKIPLKTLIIVTFLARIPVNMVFAFAGDGIADANTTLVIYVIAVGLMASALAWWKRDALERIVKNMSGKNKNKA